MFIKSLIVLFCLSFIFNLAQAQVLFPPGAVSGGLGGSGRSAVDLGESEFLNPASVAHIKGAGIAFGLNNRSSFTQESHLGVISNPSLTPSWLASNLKQWHLSLTENTPDSFMGSSLSFGHTQSQGSFSLAPQLHPEWTEAWLTLANFIHPQVSAGLTYHYRNSKYETPQTYQQHNGSLGVLWAISDHFGLGLSWLNFMPPPAQIPTDFVMESSTGLGLLYIYKEYLKLRFDLAQNTHPLATLNYDEASMGLENAMTPWVSSRIGFGIQKTADHFHLQKWTLGLSFDGPRFGIRYGFQYFTPAIKATEHSVDFILPF